MVKVELLEIDFGRSDFEKFLSPWLISWEGGNGVVDPGPSVGIPSLVRELRGRGIERLDWIFLTHIHIDHAGGVGTLLGEIPADAVLVHPKGRPHLADPTRLWEGTKKVLGKLAEFYGKIEPVSEELLTFRESVQLGDSELKVLETPGHAPHHLCFAVGDYLFVGDAVGIYLQADRAVYFRPATPPPFRAESYAASLNLLKGLNPLPSKICFPHFGMAEDSGRWLSLSENQIRRWIDIIRRNFNSPLEEIISALKREDPYFSAVDSLPEHLRQREVQFIENTILGIRKYLAAQK